MRPKISPDTSKKEVAATSAKGPAGKQPRSSAQPSSVAELLTLQATAGNAAVTEWLNSGPDATGVRSQSLQRAPSPAGQVKSRPHTARDDPGEPFAPALDRAQELLDNILSSDDNPPNVSGLGPLATNMLWDLWKGGVGASFVDGNRVAADSASRLKNLAAGQAKLEQFILAYASVNPRDAGSYSASVHKDLSNLRVWAYKAEAWERAEQLKPGGAPGLDVKKEGERERLLASAKEATDTLGKLIDSAKKVSDAMPDKKWVLELPVFGQSDFGVALGHSNDVLTLINGILTISDSKDREKKVKELQAKLGGGEEHSALGAAASIDEGYTTCLKGLLALAKLSAQGAGLVARFRGLEETAAKCFELAEGVGEVVEPIIAVLEFSHGVLVLADSKATTDEKLDAAVDVYAGGVGLLGTAGVISAATVAELTLPVTLTWMEFKWVMKLGADFMTAAIAIDLAQTYNEVLRPDGNELAKNLDEVQRLYIVQSKASTPEQKAGYKMAMGRWTMYSLKEAIWKLAVDWDRAREHPLAKRFKESMLQPLLTAATGKEDDPAICIMAGAALLNLLITAFKESDKMLHDLYVEKGWITEKKGEKKAPAAVNAGSEG
jgi:hypothetical protein